MHYTTTPINVMLIEDHPDFRYALETVFSNVPTVNLAKQFGNAELALRFLEEERQLTIDVILLDLNLPGMSGLKAFPWIKKYAPEVKVIVLSQDDNQETVLDAIQLGVVGYLLKSSTMEVIIAGINEVHGGGASLDPTLAKFVLDILKNQAPHPVLEVGISKREKEVISLIAEGLSQKQVAAELGISSYTVTDHLKSVYEKLDVQNAPQAVAKAIKTGIL